MERGAPVLLEVLGPPCQQPAAALAGLPRACTADICRIIHIFRLRGGSGLGFPQPRLSRSLPACWGGSTPPFPTCSTPRPGHPALHPPRVLRTRRPPSPRCRVTPAGDRPEEPSRGSLPFPAARRTRHGRDGPSCTGERGPAAEQSPRCWREAAEPVGCPPHEAGPWARGGTRCLPGAMQGPLPSLTPPKTSPCQHVPPLETQPGGCRIKPLILLPFNPPCAAAAPTSSRAPLPI